jgi:hypothetical protein
VRLSPLGTSAAVGLLYQPRMIDDDYGAVGGIIIGRGNRSTRRKPAPVPLCPPQIPHDLGSNPGRRGGKPATNRLSYGTAFKSPNFRFHHNPSNVACGVRCTGIFLQLLVANAPNNVLTLRLSPVGLPTLFVTMTVVVAATCKHPAISRSSVAT